MHLRHLWVGSATLALAASSAAGQQGATGSARDSVKDSVGAVTAAIPPTNAELLATDRDTRSHDYHLIHQRIEVSDFDWDSTAFRGRTTSTLVVRAPAVDSIVLDAGAMLDVSSVTNPQGAVLRTSRHGDTLVVHLARAATLGDTVRFAIAYQGHVENGRGLTFITPDGAPHRPKQIWSQGESQDNHLWFPTYDFPDDKMTWEVVATVPTGYVAVSNGRLVSDAPAGTHGHSMHWSQDKPSATYLVSIVIAPLAKLADSWHGVPVDYYVYHEDSARARRLFGVTPDMIDVYSRLTGVPYPWSKYAQSTVADFFGGMENVSATTLVDWIPDSAAYHDRPWFQYILIPHELAHQWFGDYVTTENWSNLWLNEGFAEFMPGQYWRAKLGAHAEEDYYLDEYRQYMGLEAQHSMPVAAPASNNIYPKGALVLGMLRHYLGDARFWQAVHYYLTHHALGNAISEDLREAVLETTGDNLAWFWDEWLYNAGFPRINVTAAMDSGAGRLTLTVRQNQGNGAHADTTMRGGRYIVSPVFRMPLRIRVGTSGGDIVVHRWLDSAQQTIAIDGIHGAPTMVVVDDSNAILKQLTFDEPTPWLANQLTHDEILWNRAWVIEQLGHRSNDSVAARALAGAAESADYWLTRQEAVTALGEFPARWASSAVERATHDTAAGVRQSAAAALARVDSARAITRLREMTADRSYEVRAAVLTALARVDVTNRSQLITQGLKTPSYRDVIQDAALEAAVQSHDTTLVPQVAQLADRTRDASMVLAAFAREGSGTALAALTHELNDPRPTVWQSALIAIARGLPQQQALDALRGSVGSLTQPDTRRIVESLIERLAASK